MTNQHTFNFERAVDELIDRRTDLVRACREATDPTEITSVGDACEEVAVACKRAIRDTGLSRDQILDEVNQVLGLAGGANRKSISSHMWNHYLSKPTQYPMPAYLVMAVCVATGSLEPIQALADPMGARVISRDEVRLMHLGKVETLHNELLNLRREIRRGR